MFLYILMAVYVIALDRFDGPSYIDGEVDNAPKRGAQVMIMSSPFMYVLFLVFNVCDRFFDRYTMKMSWFSSVWFYCVLGISIYLLFFDQRIDSFTITGFIYTVVGSIICFIPMSLLRRLVIPKIWKNESNN